jgi:hypothetical protein
MHDGSPLIPIYPETAVPANARLANRVLSREVKGLEIMLGVVDPAVAASHLVDSEAQKLLRTNLTDTFLARRAAAVDAAITEHVQRMTEWGARDGRSVRDMIRATG